MDCMWQTIDTLKEVDLDKSDLYRCQATVSAARVIAQATKTLLQFSQNRRGVSVSKN